MSLTDSTTRSISVVAGSATATFTYPNLITYKMPSTGYISGKDQVAMKSINIYYSWPNISAALGNNSFSYIWNGTSFPVVMSDGIYAFSDIINYLQQVMISNGHFLMNGTIQQFYISLVVNPVLYCLSLTCTPIPSVLPANWTNPNAVVLSGLTPQLTIPSGIPGGNSSFSTITGFTAATYPAAAGAAVYQVNSGIPQIIQTTSLSLLCNLVDNKHFSLSPSVLTSFNMPSASLAGALIQQTPNNLEYQPVLQQQTFTTIELRLVDQLGRPVIVRDPSGLVIVLNLRRRAE